jgi:hypothetical protein
VAEGLNVGNLEVNPVLAVEDLGALLELDGGAGAVVTVKTSTKARKTNTDVDRGQVGLRGRGRRNGTLGGLGGLSRVLAEALLQIAELVPSKHFKS